MTTNSNQTGNQSESENGPWNWAWNKIKQIVNPDDPINVPNNKPSTKPWEMSWRDIFSTRPEPPPPKPIEVKAPSKSIDLGEFERKLVNVESSGNPSAAAKTSSAKGLHQFTAGTWMDLVNELNLPYTLKDRTDPEKSSQVFKELTSRNLNKAKEVLGRDPSMHELYAFHFLGQKGASKLLQADEATPVSDVLTKRAINANKALLEGKNVGQVIELFKRKFK